MARVTKPTGTGRVVAVGGPNAPKPSRMRVGGTTSRSVRLVISSEAVVVPAMPTMRRSMSTKLPDSGRSDHRVSAVTWNSTIIPLPRLVAVTSGVPSASVAQVRSARPASGSASTWRVTLTSFGTGILPNGPSFEKAVRGCGWSQLRLPPSVRPPRRSFTGTRSSSEPARRGPANRTSMPPSSIQAMSRSRASPETLPTSASMIIGTFCSMKRRTASAGDATSARRTSANGLSARDR